MCSLRLLTVSPGPLALDRLKKFMLDRLGVGQVYKAGWGSVSPGPHEPNLVEQPRFATDTGVQLRVSVSHQSVVVWSNFGQGMRGCVYGPADDTGGIKPTRLV